MGGTTIDLADSSAFKEGLGRRFPTVVVSFGGLDLVPSLGGMGGSKGKANKEERFSEEEGDCCAACLRYQQKFCDVARGLLNEQ